MLEETIQDFLTISLLNARGMIKVQISYKITNFITLH